MRLFQNNNYISIDFLNHKVESFTFNKNSPKPINNNLIERITKYNAIKKELVHFIDCINNNKKPVFDSVLATKALKIAINIQNKINV